MNSTVNYSTHAEKQRLYVERTLPLIFAQALEAGPVNVSGTPRQIHEWLRAGVYVREDGPLDEVLPVAQTLASGGDCEDWTAALGAIAQQRGWSWRVVTAGDARDNFRHVYPEVMVNGQWVAMDAKGNARGLDYGQQAKFAVKRYWSLDGSRLVELTGSGCSDCDSLEGSGALASDFIPRTARQLVPGVWQANRRNEDGTLSYDRVSAEMAAQINGAARTQYTGPAPQQQPGTQQFVAAQAAKIKRVDDDKFLSAFMAAQLPLDQVIQVTDAMGIAGDESKRRAAIADEFVVAAKMEGKPLRELARLTGVAVPSQDDELSGSLGIFDSIGSKVRDTIDVAGEKLRAVQTGVGVAIEQFGRGILSLQNKAPWAAQYFFRPLGFDLVATAAEQLGAAIRDGSIKTFDTRKLLRSTGTWFTAVGTALAFAAPYTGPFAPLFAACAAINTGIGKAITTMVDQREAYAMGAQKQTIQVDQYGRQVDASGQLVDPLQRIVAGAQTSKAAQPSQPALTRGEDGLYYGWLYYPEFGWLWTAHDAISATEARPRAAWIENERRWAQVRAA